MPEEDTQETGVPEAKTHYKTLNVGVGHGGDKVGVLTVNGFKEMTLGDEYYGQAAGVFTGDFEEEANSFNPPMMGKIDGTGATLKHLASFFKIAVNNIPPGRDDMKFVFTADKMSTGEFIVDLSSDTPVIQTDDSEGNTVTINFTNNVPDDSCVFYIPAPLGDYGTITAEIKDGETSLLTKTRTNQTVSRKTPKKGTAGLDYVAEINGTPY